MTMAGPVPQEKSEQGLKSTPGASGREAVRNTSNDVVQPAGNRASPSARGTGSDRNGQVVEAKTMPAAEIIGRAEMTTEEAAAAENDTWNWDDQEFAAQARKFYLKQLSSAHRAGKDTRLNRVSEFKRLVKNAGKVRLDNNRQALEMWREYINTQLTPQQVQAQVYHAEAADLLNPAGSMMSELAKERWLKNPGPNARKVEQRLAKGNIRGSCEYCHEMVGADYRDRGLEGIRGGPQASPIERLAQHGLTPQTPAPDPQILPPLKEEPAPGERQVLGAETSATGGFPAAQKATRLMRQISHYPYLLPLGPGGYSVLPQEVLGSTDPAEKLLADINRLISLRQSDYQKFSHRIDEPDFNYLDLRPIVRELLPLADTYVRWKVEKEISQAKEWESVKEAAIGAATIGMLILIVFPPTSPAGVAGAYALGATVVANQAYSGYSDFQQGKLLALGQGAHDVLDPEQQDAAAMLMAGGMINMIMAAVDTTQLGGAGVKLLRGPAPRPRSVGKLMSIEQTREGYTVRISQLDSADPHVRVTAPDRSVLYDGPFTGWKQARRRSLAPETSALPSGANETLRLPPGPPSTIPLQQPVPLAPPQPTVTVPPGAHPALARAANMGSDPNFLGELSAGGTSSLTNEKYWLRPVTDAPPKSNWVAELTEQVAMARQPVSDAPPMVSQFDAANVFVQESTGMLDPAVADWWLKKNSPPSNQPPPALQLTKPNVLEQVPSAGGASSEFEMQLAPQVKPIITEPLGGPDSNLFAGGKKSSVAANPGSNPNVSPPGLTSSEMETLSNPLSLEGAAPVSAVSSTESLPLLPGTWETSQFSFKNIPPKKPLGRGINPPEVKAKPSAIKGELPVKKGSDPISLAGEAGVAPKGVAHPSNEPVPRSNPVVSTELPIPAKPIVTFSPEEARLQQLGDELEIAQEHCNNARKRLSELEKQGKNKTDLEWREQQEKNTKTQSEFVKARNRFEAERRVQGLSHKQIYDRLRDKTPNAEMLRAAASNPCPYAPGVSPDHIIPFEDVIDMPGFDRLPPDMQIKIINHPKNTSGMDSYANSSKSDKLWSAKPDSKRYWDGHIEKFGQVPPEARLQMVKAEAQAKVALQEAIQESLQKLGL